MPKFVEAITLGELAMMVAIVTAVVAVLRRVLPALRKASRLVDDVVGVEESAPGRGDGRPGVMDRIGALEVQVKQISDTTAATVVQVHPNGGSSMRDQVDRLTATMAEMRELLEQRLPEERP